MEKKNKKHLWISAGLILSFALWTILVGVIDVQSIGPLDSAVGFATFNGFIHKITGVNLSLYTITDWLGLVPIATAFGFALFGLIQRIKRKSFLKTDKSILALGVFYIVVIAVYVLFEYIVINRRPTLIEGRLEASYPSSTTMLVTCVMPTAAIQIKSRIKNIFFRRILLAVLYLFIAFMVMGRLISGVHWITDIIGGLLISEGLVQGYKYYFYCYT
jgi:undecaprenyl-diphosphatase